MMDALAARFEYQPDGRLVKKSTKQYGDTDINQAGYRRVRWDRGTLGVIRVLAHRLVWYIHNGVLSDDVLVDHINGDCTDNRIENLRLVSKSGNSQNSVRKGYCKESRSGKYRAEITLNGKTKYLGLFGTAKEARAAYVAAKAVLHECATARTLKEE